MEYNNIHYIIALLKAYGINTIVASPGTQNSYFNYLVQEDSFFRCYSVLDERSAAYMAVGFAYESQKPVVITCTGATASRNYLSAMTEAYYRKIPVIALTFIDAGSNCYNIAPQFVDRSVSPNDVKTVNVSLPIINSEHAVQESLTMLNYALSESVYNNNPVHIDSPSCIDFDNKIKGLPQVWTTKYYDENFIAYKDANFNDKKVAVFIGSHKRFTQEEEKAISDFVEHFDIPVFCDNTSNYHGKNKILTAKIPGMKRLKHFPDVVIDIGMVSGDYNYLPLLRRTVLWRVSRDTKFRNRMNRPLEKFFNCTELTFFTKMISLNIPKQGLYNEIKTLSDSIKIPDLPLCNSLICQELSKHLPKNSSLYVSILNSLRNSNYYEFDDSIILNSNVGGFGIDGGVSTIVGQSLNDKEKMCFGLIGDSAFFYDMNVLGNRHISNNLRLLLVNNGRGIEFRLKLHICEQKIGEKADKLIAAANHYKNGAKGWAESCCFEYMKAETKAEFLAKIEQFCNSKCGKPILFEVFTSTVDEQNGLIEMQSFNKDKLEETLIKCYRTIIK